MPGRVAITTNPATRSKSPPWWKEHYDELLLFLCLCRFATTKQICRRFHSVYTTGASGERTCNRHLKQLRDNGHIDSKDYRPVNPTLPSIHYCKPKGVRHANKRYTPSSPFPESETPPTHDRLLHELGITQFAVVLSESVATREDLDVARWEQRYGYRGKALEFTNHTNEPTKLQPDASFLLRHHRGESTPHTLLHFLEVDRGNMTPGKVYAKLRNRYTDWYESSEGQQFLTDTYRRCGREPKLIFRLLLVAHADDRYASAESRLTHLYLAALSLPDYARDTLWFTTADELEQPQAITQPIWWRGRDACRWLTDFQTFTATLPAKSKRKNLEARRQCVAEQLEQGTKTCLFPLAISEVGGEGSLGRKK